MPPLIYQQHAGWPNPRYTIVVTAVAVAVMLAVAFALIPAPGTNVFGSILQGAGCGLFAGALVMLAGRPIHPRAARQASTLDPERFAAVRRAVRTGRPERVEPRDSAQAVLYARITETLQFRTVRVSSALAIGLFLLAIGGLTQGPSNPFIGSLEFAVVVLWPVAFIVTSVIYAVQKRNRRRFLELA